jgi:hypothetical protein
MPDLCFCLQSRWPELSKPVENLSKNEGSPPSGAHPPFPNVGGSPASRNLGIKLFPNIGGSPRFPNVGASPPFRKLGAHPTSRILGAHPSFRTLGLISPSRKSPAHPPSHMLWAQTVCSVAGVFLITGNTPPPRPPWRPLTEPFGPVWLQVAMALSRWPESRLS